ncbi:MAG: response regulator [Candidatus Taylorbacteria bacterium]|nr:response regulator [Candidatus Taylorbacteria bacterium]
MPAQKTKKQTKGFAKLAVVQGRRKELMGASKALVIDDDTVVRRNLVEFITRKGLRCLEAEDYREGLKRLADGPFDLLMIDFSLPDGTGDRLIADARYRYPQARIISMKKPFRPEDFERIV